MYSFGSGVLIGTRTDIANATPVNFGLVQEVAINETSTIKELYGQFQHPVAIARGTKKITGTAKVARVSGLAFASLYFGVTPTPGQTATAFLEAGAVGNSPYTYIAANGATFVADLGVVYAATGLPLTKVAGAPTQGQYSVGAGGVYTFASADTGKAILASYTYTLAAAGQSFQVSNQLLGTTPTFSASFYTTFQGQAINVQYPCCTASKLMMSTKLEDFVIPEFDFSCFANAAGTVETWSFAEAS